MTTISSSTDSFDSMPPSVCNMITISFYTESCYTLGSVEKQVIDKFSSQARGRQYTILPKDDKFSILYNKIEIDTFYLETGAIYGVLQERKITFSSPDLKPMIMEVIDAIIQDIRHERARYNIKNKYIMPAEINDDEIEANYPISNNCKSLEPDGLQEIMNSSSDLRIAINYNEQFYCVSAEKLFQSQFFKNFLDGIFNRDEYTLTWTHWNIWNKVELRIIENKEKTDPTQSLFPYFFLSLQAQSTEFKTWGLPKLLMAYAASDYYGHQDIKESLFSEIKNREIEENNENDESIEILDTFLHEDTPLIQELIKKNGFFLQVASLEDRNKPEIVFQAILANKKALKYAILDLHHSYYVTKLIKIKKFLIKEFILNNVNPDDDTLILDRYLKKYFDLYENKTTDVDKQYMQDVIKSHSTLFWDKISQKKRETSKAYAPMNQQYLKEYFYINKEDI